MPLFRCLHFSHDLTSSFRLPIATGTFQLCATLSDQLTHATVHNSSLEPEQTHTPVRIASLVPESIDIAVHNTYLVVPE